MPSQDWFEKDFYAVLGVPKDATQDAIKKAYRKLARTHHPDANPGDAGAERRFKEIGEAYGVLSDAEQRKQYDAIRAMSRGGARFSAGGAPGGAAGAAGFEDLLGNLFGGGAAAGGPGPRVRFGTPGGPGGPGGPGVGSPIFEDLLSGMFAGGAGPGPAGGGAYRGARGPLRGEDLTAEATLTFDQALEGALLSLRVDDPQSGTRTVNARIPAGVRDGQKVRLRGKGRAGDYGSDPGDLVVTVRVEAHPVFTVDGADVRLTLPVTVVEAVLGAEVEAPTPDGGRVRLKVPAGTPSGRVLRVRGRGVKAPRRTGDLLVQVQIVVPQRLDSAAREALEKFAAATAGADPREEMFARVQASGRAGGAGAGDDR